MALALAVDATACTNECISQLANDAPDGSGGAEDDEDEGHAVAEVAGVAVWPGVVGCGRTVAGETLVVALIRCGGGGVLGAG